MSQMRQSGPWLQEQKKMSRGEMRKALAGLRHNLEMAGTHLIYQKKTGLGQDEICCLMKPLVVLIILHVLNMAGVAWDLGTVIILPLELRRCTQVRGLLQHKSQVWHLSFQEALPSNITLEILLTLARVGTPQFYLRTTSPRTHNEETELGPSQVDPSLPMWEDCFQYKREVKDQKSHRKQKVEYI